MGGREEGREGRREEGGRMKKNYYDQQGRKFISLHIRGKCTHSLHKPLSI